MKKSKAQRIRELYAKGMSTREIADRVGCRSEYVRVVARQRGENGMSEADKRYLQNNREAVYARQAVAKRRYRKENLEKCRAEAREYYRKNTDAVLGRQKTNRDRIKDLCNEHGLLDCARERGRQAYAKARKNGAPARKAQTAYAAAFTKQMRKSVRELEHA